MSEEDIHVVYKQMDTAYFNPKDRELGLPIWDETKTTADIEDLMVCHEIAHALWTPLDMLEKAQVRKINFSFVNIVEDARIERKVQDKYRGSVAVFKRGYRDLTALDFFGIGDKDVSKLNLIDRINLFFKKQDVEFSAEEQVWVDRVANTKTPEDVLDLAEELYKWMEENESETDNHDTGEDIGTPDPSGEKGESKSPEGSGEENNEGNDNGNNDSKSDADESGSDVESKSGNGSGEDEIDETSKDNFKDSNPEGGTQSSAGSAPVATTDTGSGIDSLRDKDAKDRVYGRIPDTSKLDLVVSYEKLLSDFKKVIVRNTSKELDPCWTAHARYVESVLTQLDTMKKESKKTVAYMVKEFEMKKSADAYARAAVSKTGSLDMGKLHTYKYNDDVFKKVTTLPGATNHGMVMVLDWSGSMAENLEGTVSQLFNLIWFCRQTRIPFVVYAFSDQYGSHYDSRRSTNWENFKSGDIILRKMNLLTLFSSNMNIKEEMEMMHNCLMVSKQWSFSEYQNVGNPIRFPRELNLGGTPLNEAIIAMMDIVPKFKADTGVQKVNTIFLTDGAATSLEGVYTYKLNRETGEHSKDATSCNQYWNDKSFMITDPKTNKTYEVSNKYAVATDTFLEILKNRVDGMNVVGFFIAGKGKSGKVDKRTLIGLLREDSYEQIMEKVKFINKEKYLAISQAGYDEYYILPGGNSLMTENDVLGDELIGASKSKLKAAFGKSMAGKISSRQLLNKFVKLVA
tara:strand:- start:390 stop:2615 length:2226 start_codon:yes stop_codon:yes gene_type:complete